MGSKLRITEAVIKRMLADSSFVRTFKFLQNPPTFIRKAPKGCRSCGKKKEPVNTPQIDIAAIRKAIAEMTESQQEKMKNLFHVKKIYMIYNAGDGTTEVTF